MEFPDLGTHCSLPECNQLDFLPFKCDACQQIFCKEHYPYTKHNCSQVKDRKVPTCPLCNNPVSLSGEDHESVDLVVNRHIENNCQFGKKKTKTKCNAEGCREKEFVKVECSRCYKIFCLPHRHPPDHHCVQPSLSKSGAAALARANNFFKNTASIFTYKSTHPQDHHSHPQKNTYAQTNTQTSSHPQRVTAFHVHSLQQPGLTEEEALQRALEESRGGDTSNDEHIARTLQQNEYLNEPPVTSSKKNNCHLS